MVNMWLIDLWEFYHEVTCIFFCYVYSTTDQKKNNDRMPLMILWRLSNTFDIGYLFFLLLLFRSNAEYGMIWVTSEFVVMWLWLFNVVELGISLFQNSPSLYFPLIARSTYILFDGTRCVYLFSPHFMPWLNAMNCHEPFGFRNDFTWSSMDF